MVMNLTERRVKTYRASYPNIFDTQIHTFQKQMFLIPIRCNRPIDRENDRCYPEAWLPREQLPTLKERLLRTENARGVYFHSLYFEYLAQQLV